MDWLNKFPSPKFRKRYEEKCFRDFKKLGNHDDCRIRYEILQFFIIMTMTNYLTLTKILIYLDSFLKNVNLT